MSMESGGPRRTQSGEQTFIPFQGSFRTGLQTGGVLNSLGLAGWLVMWLMPSTRFSGALNIIGGGGWFFNTLKDWMGVFTTRVQALPASELQGRDGLVDLQFHLKARPLSLESGRLEKKLQTTIDAVKEDNKKLQQRLNGMDVVISEEAFLVSADDPSANLWTELQGELKTRTQLRSQLASKELRSNITAKLEGLIGTFEELKETLKLTLPTNGHTQPEQTDSSLPPQWNTLISYVQAFKAAFEAQGTTLASTSESLESAQAESKEKDTRIAKLRGELVELRRTAEEAKGSSAKEAEELQRRLAQLDGEREERTRTISSLTESLGRFRVKDSQHQESDASNKAAIAQLRADLELAKSNLDSKEKALKKAEAQQKESDEAHKKQLADTQRHLSQVQAQVAALMEGAPEARAQKEASETAKREHEQALEALRKELTTARQEVSTAQLALEKANGELQTQLGEAKASSERHRLQTIKAQQDLLRVQESHRDELNAKDAELGEARARGDKYKAELSKLTEATKGKLTGVEELTATASAKERRLAEQLRAAQAETESLKRKAQDSERKQQEQLSGYHIQMQNIELAIKQVLTAMGRGKGAEAVNLLKLPKEVTNPWYRLINQLNTLIEVINKSKQSDIRSALSSAESTPQKGRRPRARSFDSPNSSFESPGRSFASPNTSFTSDTDE